jgi:putative transposase
VLPVLYLRGLSTGDFRPALEQLLGEDAAGLSPSTISRLCKDWEAEHARFRTRSLRFHRYAYLFVDAVHVSVRLGEDDRLCLLVVIGVRQDGVKELLAVEDGYRESTESWAGVMRDLKARGLNEPRLVIGDGALGIWAALRDVFPAARKQTCWVHKIARVLDALPKRLQPRAKSLLHEIMEAPSRADARAALERFREEFDAKYPKAVAKLDRDGAALTAFYDFPAEHWRHLRTSNAIESSFATVKLRTRSRRAPAPRRPRSRWPTSCSTPPRNAGGDSTATSSSPTCSPARRSRTASGSPRTRPRRRTRGSPPDSGQAAIHNI